MSETLSKIMNEDTFSPPSAPWSKKASPSPSKSGSYFPWILLGIAILVGLAVYFKPRILNFLSLPEKIIEEEVKEKVDAPTKKKKFGKGVKTSQEIVDKAGVLEEQGYCYIGTDRGIRSCIDVTPGDKCMSGQIFPRRDICVNPSLRL